MNNIPQSNNTFCLNACTPKGSMIGMIGIYWYISIKKLLICYFFDIYICPILVSYIWVYFGILIYITHITHTYIKKKYSHDFNLSVQKVFHVYKM